MKSVLTIYIDKLSPYSQKLKNDLVNKGIIFTEKKVDENENDALEMYVLTKKSVVPVIKIENNGQTTVLIGYNEENKQKLEQFFKQS